MIHNRATERRGVTLIEMMIVVVLLSLVSALALPKLNLAQFRTDNSVRAVRTALQSAQRLAITRQYDVIVSFDTVNQRIRTIEDLNNNYKADAGERVSWTPLDDGVHFAPPGQGGVSGGAAGWSVLGTNVMTIDGMPSVVFLRSGSASTNLEVYLSAPGSEGSEWRAVQVTQSTGRTVWYRWLVTAWAKASV